MDQRIAYPQATAVIMTALPLESEIVCRHLSNLSWILHPSKSKYQLGFFKSFYNTTGWAVIVAETRKRNVQAAISTERAIQYFDPDIIIFVGCAGARKDCKIGDVVVASRIHDYESGAETESGFQGDNEGVAISFALNEELNSLSKDEEWKSKAIKPKNVKQTYWKKIFKNSKVVIGPTASGEKTQKISNTSAEKNIQHAQRDAVALESEGHGFLKAVSVNEPMNERAFVVRGISDYGPWEDPKSPRPPKDPQTDKYTQPTAIELAATFAFHYISKQSPRKRLYESSAQGTLGIYRAISENFYIPDVPFVYRKLKFQSIILNFDRYANAGFFAEAIALRIAGKQPQGIDKYLLCEIITLCQKAGHIDLAWRLIFYLLSSHDSLEVPIQAHLYLMALKLLSQSENIETRKTVTTCYSHVVNWLKITNDQKKIASIYSRAGVAFAITNDNSKSKECFQLALKHAKKYGNAHQQITVNILWAIASALRGVEFKEDPIQTVVEAQYHYLDSKNMADPQFAQAYPMKSAIQCLFAEAAIYMRGRDIGKANLRLAAAAILRRKAFSSPNAEGFAELLAMIPDDETRKRLRFVMDPSEDISGDQILQPYLKECMPLLQIFSFSVNHWKQLRNLLDN